MATGWVSIHRKIFDNPLWLAEKFTKAQAWIDLILLANHEKGYIMVRGIKLDIDRGQVGWSEVALSARWKWSRTKVKNFLKLLEKEQQIVQQKNNVSLIITITNYNSYQKKDSKKSSKVDSKSATEEQQKDPNNNVNNENNENKLLEEFELFWEKYQKKEDRKKCLVKWKLLKAKEKDLIFKSVDAYVKSTPDKKYRKNPLTWLNGECWDNEILEDQKTSSGVYVPESEIIEYEYDEHGRPIF